MRIRWRITRLVMVQGHQTYLHGTFQLLDGKYRMSVDGTMPPQKRPTDDDDDNGTPAKQIKTEHPEEFSNAVKKRLQSSSRTGQACDRCKVSPHLRPAFIRA